MAEDYILKPISKLYFAPVLKRKKSILFLKKAILGATTVSSKEESPLECRVKWRGVDKRSKEYDFSTERFDVIPNQNVYEYHLNPPHVREMSFLTGGGSNSFLASKKSGEKKYYSFTLYHNPKGKD